jgi:hypothetical protein
MICFSISHLDNKNKKIHEIPVIGRLGKQMPISFALLRHKTLPNFRASTINSNVKQISIILAL